MRPSCASRPSTRRSQGEGAAGPEDVAEPQVWAFWLGDLGGVKKKVKNSEGENLLEMLVLYMFILFLFLFSILRDDVVDSKAFQPNCHFP